MRNTNTLITWILVVLTTVSSWGQPGISWQKTLGGSGGESALAAIEVSDGSNVMVGYTYSRIIGIDTYHGGYDVWVVKLSGKGDVLWQKAFGGSGNEMGYNVVETSDKGFIIACTTNSHDGDVSGNHGQDDGWVLKIDVSGNIIWKTVLGASGFDHIYSIKPTPDGGCIGAGWTSSTDGAMTGNNGGFDSWVFRLDNAGTLVWQKTIGGSGYDRAQSVVNTLDGGYAIAGWSESSNKNQSWNHGGSDAWICKLSNNGDIEWQKLLGGSWGDWAYDIIQTQDYGYLLVGKTESHDGDVKGQHGSEDGWVIKLNQTGDIEWQRTMGGSDSDSANSVVQTYDGGYVIAGWAGSDDANIKDKHGELDAWIVKLNCRGSIEWQMALGGSENDVANTVVQTKDGGFLMAGWIQSSDGDIKEYFGGFDAWIVKLNIPIVNNPVIIPEHLITRVCDNESIKKDLPNVTSINYLSSLCNDDELLSPYTDFYLVRINKGSTFTFTVVPDGDEDYDFISWLNPDWSNLLSTGQQNIRSSLYDPEITHQYMTGLSPVAVEYCEDATTKPHKSSGFLKHYDVQGYDEILIAVSRKPQTKLGYTLTFGGNADVKCVVDGITLSKCDINGTGKVFFEYQDLKPAFYNICPIEKYSFFKSLDDAKRDSMDIDLPVMIDIKDGNTNNLFIRVEDERGVLIRIIKVYLEVTPSPELMTSMVVLPTVCDDEGIGMAEFDLSESESLFVDKPDYYNFTYYKSFAEAILGNDNFIQAPRTYFTGSITLFVRITYKTGVRKSAQCYSVGMLEIRVGKEEQLFLHVESCSPYYWQGIMHDTSGRYYYKSETVLGCDSVLILDLVVHPNNVETVYQTSCGSFAWGDQLYEESGSYSQIFSNIYGCDSIVELSLQIYPEYEYFDTITSENKYRWPVTNVEYAYAGMYTEALSTSHGCDSIYHLVLQIEESVDIEFPNVLGRNGRNRYFTAYTNQDVVINTMSVFDRWGNKVFQNENFPPNVPEMGWNGTLDGEKVSTGVYVWVASVKLKNDNLKTFYGNVTILR